MKKFSMILIIPALLFFAPLLAADEESTDAQVQSMLEEVERTRQEAEVARQGAMKAAEMAREAARMNARISRENARIQANEARQQSDQASEQRERERAIRQEGMARAREELGKAHRELREATREVAKAHRELSHVEHVREVSYHINLGDRAVIGVVLGRETDKGVQLIGVTPDGPAERAGLQQGDVLVSIRGVNLAGNDKAREVVFEVMSEADDGEELAVVVDRAGETWEYTVTAEHREPRSWQSVIRIPEIEAAAAAAAEQAVIAERIQVPEIDEEALADRVAQLAERLETSKFVFATSDAEGMDHHAHRYDIEIAEFSDLGEYAMSEARMWYGLPRAHGLELTSINEGLGAYFKTDRGVLVIEAKADNAYQLESGDVILSVGSTQVNSPSDMMRALREIDPGSELEIVIKRNRRDETLKVVVPENRLGHR